ncbi:hypothetical protein MUU48_19385 [Scandinavium sp. H11S7]|uniref:hypothetical protein n=1 Tax=Scandinavium hiltneri TaxID=2926519 RepID=UPI002166A462|nr:hypothetical protein [Scandinavium hiltneri]MCS2159045.1 hypothetical protein [Scandinavium hiltneri]
MDLTVQFERLNPAEKMARRQRIFVFACYLARFTPRAVVWPEGKSESCHTV